MTRAGELVNSQLEEHARQGFLVPFTGALYQGIDLFKSIDAKLFPNAEEAHHAASFRARGKPCMRDFARGSKAMAVSSLFRSGSWNGAMWKPFFWAKTMRA